MTEYSEDFDWEEVEMYEERYSRIESRYRVKSEGSGSDLSSLDVLFGIIKKVDASLEGSEEARQLGGIP